MNQHWRIIWPSNALDHQSLLDLGGYRFEAIQMISLPQSYTSWIMNKMRYGERYGERYGGRYGDMVCIHKGLVFVVDVFVFVDVPIVFKIQMFQSSVSRLCISTSFPTLDSSGSFLLPVSLLEDLWLG